MDAQQIYDLIAAHLENEICNPQEKMGKLKRIKLPIPKEYGGGVVTGYGYEDTIRNLIDRVKEKIKMESEAPLFKDCWEAWIRIKEGQTRSPSTVGNYRYIAHKHLLPFFGEKPMDQITPDDIQTYYNGLMNLSGSVSTQSKAILCGIFDRAARMGDIDRNIMLYQYERSRKAGEKVVLQDEDLIGVISQIDKLKDTGDIRDYLYFCFLCFTSMRRGEILGIRWKDVDFSGERLFVRNNVTYPNGQSNPIIREPKDGSYGTVYLHAELALRIKPYQRFGNNYVLPYSFDEASRPITRSMFDKMWKRINKTINLKGATSHSFRASYVTMMNAHCEHADPKVLQGALRHKTPDLALKVYTKENGNKTRQAEEEYGRWLSDQLAK